MYNIYSYHTPSHDCLFNEWFVPSIPNSLNLISVRDDTQHCHTAQFRQGGWRETQINKVSTWIDAINDNMGKIIICSDVDIQWFKPDVQTIIDYLNGRDLVVQSYHDGTICSGFFACKCETNTINLWQHILNDLREQRCDGEQDLLLNALKCNYSQIKWEPLPKKFFTPNKQYSDLEQIRHQIPNDIVLHHATYTIGIKNKIAQLKFVRDHYERLAGK